MYKHPVHKTQNSNIITVQYKIEAKAKAKYCELLKLNKLL